MLKHGFTPKISFFSAGEEFIMHFYSP